METVKMSIDFDVPQAFIDAGGLTTLAVHAYGYQEQVPKTDEEGIPVIDEDGVVELIDNPILPEDHIRAEEKRAFKQKAKEAFLKQAKNTAIKETIEVFDALME